MVIVFETLVPITLLVISSFGFGFVVATFLGARGFRSPVFYLLIGASLLIAIGGWLNVLGIFRYEFVVGWTVLGILFTVWFAFQRSRSVSALFEWVRLNRSEFFLSLIAITAVVFVFLRNSGYGWINGHDDMEAYMAFAEKLEQTGSMGDDPFSRRRLVSSLGGQTVLDAAFLALGPAYGLKSVDMSLGFLALTAIAAFWAKRSWLGKVGSLLFLLLSAFYWLPSANVTSHYFVMAGILAVLFFVTNPREEFSRGDWLILCLIFATSMTLKTTTTTFLLLLLPLIAAVLFSFGPRLFLRNSFVLASALLLIVLPFSLSLRNSSGTFFYPFLGKGFQAAHLSLDFVSTTTSGSLFLEFAKVPFRRPEMLVASLLVLIALVIGRKKKNIALLYTTLAGILALFVPYYASSGSFDATRYAASIFYPILLAAVLQIPFSLAFNRVLASGSLVVLTLVSSSPYLSLSPRVPFQFYLSETPAWLSGERYRSDLDRVRAIQALAPEGSSIIVNGPTAYLWDFNSHRVLIADLPGSASPPPGLDLSGSLDSIADFLEMGDVDYLVADYTGHFDHDAFKYMLAEDYPPQWRNDVANQFRYYEVALELRSLCGAIYDDGTTLLVAVGCP